MVAEGTVVFLDSGIGGLSHCPEFLRQSQCSHLVYLADTANFPYGSKDAKTLQRILIGNIDALLKQVNPCLVVIACNTASVSALDVLRKRYAGIQFVGTVPAIKPAAKFSKTRNIGIIATERTIAEPYIYDLMEKHAPDARLFTFADPHLVSFVEEHYTNSTKEEREEAVRPSVQACLAANCDAIVLACTHFLFLAEEFQALAQGRARVFDSRAGVANRATELYRACGLATGLAPREEPEFLYLETVIKPMAVHASRCALAASLGFARCNTISVNSKDIWAIP